MPSGRFRFVTFRLALCAALVLLLTPLANAQARAARASITTPEEWDADISMRLGEHRYLNGDVSGALQHFKLAAKKDPRRAEAHWRISHCLVVLDRMNEALASLEKARALEPNDARYLNTMAVVQMKLGQLRPAVETARHAVRYAPRVADVWDTLGWTYLQVGDRQQARYAFETALRLEPSHTSAQEGLGLANQR